VNSHGAMMEEVAMKMLSFLANLSLPLFLPAES
jgi:hypothetical protein